jgi:hypothetical protein
VRTHLARVLTLICCLTSLAQPAFAQDKPAPLIEVVVGRSSFIDEVWDHFTTIGAGARFFVTPRVAIGPEVAYLTGEFEGTDSSNLTVTGNITFDLVGDGAPVVPYIVAGGGFIRQKTLVGSGPGSTMLQTFSSSEGTFSGGAGARIALGPRAFVAPEFRLGSEPTMRVAVMIGFRP